MAANHPHSPVLKHHFDNLEQQHASERLGMWMFLVTELMFFGGLFCAYAAYRYYFPTEFQVASSHLIVWIAGVNTALLITSSLTMTFAIRAAQLGNRSALVTNLWATFLLGVAFLGFKAYEYKTDIDEHLVPGKAFDAQYLEAEAELKALPPEKVKDHAFDPAKHLSPLVVDLAKRNDPVWRRYEKEYRDDPRKAAEYSADPEYVSPKRCQLFLAFYWIMTGIHGIHILVGLGCILWLLLEVYGGRVPRENYSTVEVVSLYWHLVDMIWLFLMPLLYLTGAGLHASGH